MVALAIFAHLRCAEADPILRGSYEVREEEASFPDPRGTDALRVALPQWISLVFHAQSAHGPNTTMLYVCLHPWGFFQQNNCSSDGAECTFSCLRIGCAHITK